MKIKLLVLVTALGLPLISSAQSGVFFYNKGKMVVKGTNSSNTVLYIKGDFVAGAAGTSFCDVVLTDSKTVLTGNFYHDINVGDYTGASSLFRPKDASSVASFNNSVFEFRSAAQQSITTRGNVYAKMPNKQSSYVNFPTLLVNNTSADLNGALVLPPFMAVNAYSVDLQKGWFVLQSERISDGTNWNKYYAADPGATATKDRSVLAHLKVDSNVKYYHGSWSTTSPGLRGTIEVDMALDKSADYADASIRSLVGFGIPYQAMYTDYFMWNSLLEPVHASYFGPKGSAINNPRLQMTSGKGYIAGIDLRGNQYKNYAWDDNVDNVTGSTPWGAGRFAVRATDGYKFNRSLYQSNGNVQFTDVSTAAYTGEQLNVNAPVQIQLEKGFNYLANPFTAPLDITDLIYQDGVKQTAWNVTPGSTPGSRDIANRVWILSGSAQGSGRDNMFAAGTPAPDNKWLQVRMNFYIASSVGGTLDPSESYVDDNGVASKVIIAPLQMFVVYADGNTQPKITIPKTAQVMGVNKFIRSASIMPERYDDFIFELTDKKTNTSDRVSIVLRNQKEMFDKPAYSNVAKSKMTVQNNPNDKVTAENFTQSLSSMLYTKDSQGQLLSINFVPYIKDVQAKVSVPLYLKPSITEQSISIKGMRLETNREFETIQLEDKLTGKKVDMTPTTVYEASIKPSDKEDRFVLHFIKSLDGIEGEIEAGSDKSISSYYANGTLTVTGFEESDFGSVLTVYDIQGRYLRQAKVNDFTMNIVEPFSPGAFVVKVVGRNSYVAKFLVK